DLIALEPRLEVRAAAVSGVEIFVRSDVLAPTVGAALDEFRAVPAAHARDRLRGEIAQLEHVAVLDAMRMDAVGLDALAKPLCRPTLCDRRMDGVIVILANEQDGQFVERSEIQGLGEHAFFGRPVAEE